MDGHSHCHLQQRQGSMERVCTGFDFAGLGLVSHGQGRRRETRHACQTGVQSPCCVFWPAALNCLAPVRALSAYAGASAAPGMSV